MGAPFFSVVIPIYNRAAMITRTLQSVFDQTIDDYEVILVDDGSTDDLRSVMARINHPKVRLIGQINGGASRARNRGIDEAKGEYVAFLDSDDFFLPGHLESMKSLIDVQPGSVVYSQVIARREGGREFVKPPRALLAGENMASYLICDRGFLQTSTLCVPADVAKRVRYREDASFGDDTDFAIRLQLSGCNFIMAPVPNVVWSDDAEHDRLSDTRRPLGLLPWLEDLRQHIPVKAYHAYRGWHLAKSLATHDPLRAMRLYLSAVLRGAFTPRLALIVLLQIILPNRVYRRLTNRWIEKRNQAI